MKEIGISLTINRGKQVWVGGCQIKNTMITAPYMAP